MKNFTQKFIFYFIVLLSFHNQPNVHAMSGRTLEENSLHTAAPETVTLVQDLFQVDSLLPFLLLLIVLGSLGVFFIKKSTK